MLLPGLDGTGILFRPLLTALSPKIRTLTCAYPRDVFLSVGRLAELVADRICEMGRVVIVAESWSGLVCLELLRRRPANIVGVIFIACFTTPPRRSLLALSRLLPLSVLMQLPPPALLVRRYCLGAEAGPEELALFREALSVVRPRVLAERLGSLRRIDTYGDAITLPASYIQSTGDRLVPDSAVDPFRAMSATLKVHRVEGPHFLLQARPGDCARIIGEIVQPLGARLDPTRTG